MLRFKLAKGDNNEEHEPDGEQDGATRMLHGTQVLLHRLSPCYNTQRVVCADSNVASIGAAQELIRNGLRFIGVVKRATRRFPKAYLSIVELTQRGGFSGLVAMNENDGTAQINEKQAHSIQKEFDTL